jgi:hypothetical protein
MGAPPEVLMKGRNNKRNSGSTPGDRGFALKTCFQASSSLKYFRIHSKPSIDLHRRSSAPTPDADLDVSIVSFAFARNAKRRIAVRTRMEIVLRYNLLKTLQEYEWFK